MPVDNACVHVLFREWTENASGIMKELFCHRERQRDWSVRHDLVFEYCQNLKKDIVSLGKHPNHAVVHRDRLFHRVEDCRDHDVFIVIIYQCEASLGQGVRETS